MYVAWVHVHTCKNLSNNNLVYTSAISHSMGVNPLTLNSDSMHARSPCLELNIACMQFSDAVIIIHNVLHM